MHLHMLMLPKYSVSVAVEMIKRTRVGGSGKRFDFWQGVLGSRRNLVTGVLCVLGRDYEKDHQTVTLGQHALP